MRTYYIIRIYCIIRT